MFEPMTDPPSCNHPQFEHICGQPTSQAATQPASQPAKVSTVCEQARNDMIVQNDMMHNVFGQLSVQKAVRGKAPRRLVLPLVGPKTTLADFAPSVARRSSLGARIGDLGLKHGRSP